MDWRNASGARNWRMPLPAQYWPQPRVAFDEVRAQEALAWVEENVDPAVYEDRPDWIWPFEFAACEVRVAKTEAEEHGDDAGASLCAYKQLALSLVLKDRAERLGVDVKELVDQYVQFHRAFGVWEPELLIVSVAER